jgi:hypothetical protein
VEIRPGQVPGIPDERTKTTHALYLD